MIVLNIWMMSNQTLFCIIGLGWDPVCSPAAEGVSGAGCHRRTQVFFSGAREHHGQRPGLRQPRGGRPAAQG